MYAQFTSRPEHVALWAEILEHLESGTADACVQDQMDAFGTQVAEALDTLIDRFGTDAAFRVESWQREAGCFSVRVDCVDPEHELDMQALLRQCPISDIRFSDGEDE